MAELIEVGTLDGVLKYTDDNDNVLRVIIGQIITYSRAGSGYLQIGTAKGDLRLDLNTKAKVTAAITLIDSKF